MALFEPIFAALTDAGVRSVVVGGVAVVLHGHPRFTADLDIAVDLTSEAASNTMMTLARIGLVPRLPVDAGDLADHDIRDDRVRVRGMHVFALWDPNDPLRAVDIFVENPTDFEGLWSRSETVDLGGTIVHVASIPDLIELKRRAGRPQDLSDIEAFQAISEARGEPQ